MQTPAPYVMHTGMPVAGWLTIFFGVAALIVWWKYLKTFKIRDLVPVFVLYFFKE
jgi:hypothetical protein